MSRLPISCIFTGLAATMKSGAQLVIKDIDAANPLVICNKLHDLIVSGEIGHELKATAVSQLLTESHLEITGIEKVTTYVLPAFHNCCEKSPKSKAFFLCFCFSLLSFTRFSGIFITEMEY